MTPFEESLNHDLHQYLQSVGEVDAHMPDAPDIEGKWLQTAQSYIPDGMREYADYPTVSLGWMMYVGMAMATFWDKDWERASKCPDLYTAMRDARGYDALDEHIRQDILGLKGKAYTDTERLVGECAARTNNRLIRANFEPGTPAAFHGYVACLHQLYIFGAAVQLRRMGYHMTAV